MIKVTLKDGSVKELESACSVFDVAKEIHKSLDNLDKAEVNLEEE